MIRNQLDPEKLLVYAITDRGCIGERDFDTAFADALRGGAKIIQLREKQLDEAALTEEAKRLLPICRKYGALLIINDNVQAALNAGADGVHVGASDTAVSEIRRIAPKGFLIGATAKTVEQAKAAEAAGADYLGVGAVFPSPTKKDAIRITQAQFREIAAAVSIPAVAIGGISKANIRELKGSGAAGAALVSAIFSAKDIAAETAELYTLCREVFAAE